MNTNLNNIFFKIVTRSNSDHVFENDYHLRGYSGNKQKFQWSYVAFPVSMAIILFFLYLYNDKYELSRRACKGKSVYFF